VPSIFAGIFFGIFILSERGKKSVSRTVASIALIFSAWAAINFFTWLPVSTYHFEWLEKFSMLFVLFFPSMVYFTYYLTEYKIKNYVHLIIHLPIFPVLISPFTAYEGLLYSVVISEKNICHIQGGPFYFYLFFLNLFYLIWSSWVLIRRYLVPGTDKIMKRRIHFTMLSIFFFMVWVMVFQETSHFANRNLLMFVPIGMIFFVSILFYTIGRYQLLEVDLFATKFLVIIMWFLLSVQLSISGLHQRGFMHMSVGLILAIIFGIFLAYMMGQEAQRRAQLEVISSKLFWVNHELKELDREKTTFIDIASHHLRTPLTSIKGYVSMMLEGIYDPPTPVQADVLKKIFATSDRLSWAIEDILDISQIETGKMKYSFKKNSLENLIQNIVDIFVIRAKAKNLSLEFKKPQNPLPEVFVDGPKIQEVVSNLIDNAIKYTETGGVTISLENLSSHIRLIIADTGMGLEKKEISQLFSRFTRGRDMIQLTTEGVGLGLYVGKQLVEANGGKIWAESDGPGKGSRFIVELPIKQSQEVLEKAEV